MNQAVADVLESWNTMHSDPVMSLPTELVNECFRLLVFRDRIAASHVSRGWRAAALTDGFLWNSAVTPPGQLRTWFGKGPAPPPRPVRRIALEKHLALLERSAPLPFTLSWAGGPKTPFMPPELVTVVVQNMTRMQVLNLEITEPDMLRMFNCAVPVLRSFTSSSAVDSCDLPVRWGADRAPMLEALLLGFVCVPKNVQPMPALRSFSCTRLYAVSERKFRLFDIFPALCSLRIGFVSYGVLDLISDPPASLTDIILGPGTGYSALDAAPFLRACGRLELRRLQIQDINSMLDAMELFAKTFPGTWRMALGDRDEAWVNLAADSADVAYALYGMELFSLSREPSIMGHFERLSSLTASIPIFEHLDLSFKWSRSLPALRSLTIQFCDAFA
ncbi:hypothetical protein AURDEDRAFT_170605 [Auricularia subglabra TFB-10046 SS5]|nr:hypothetical protein AURDEDRAFT_170605 [Auricularia subglabra TFB-10046 SS5]